MEHGIIGHLWKRATLCACRNSSYVTNVGLGWIFYMLLSFLPQCVPCLKIARVRLCVLCAVCCVLCAGVSE